MASNTVPAPAARVPVIGAVAAAVAVLATVLAEVKKRGAILRIPSTKPATSPPRPPADGVRPRPLRPPLLPCLFTA